MTTGLRQVPTERSFGLSVGVVTLAAGTLGVWRGHHLLGPMLIAVGAALIVLGLAAPVMLRVPNRLWWWFAQALGWINARVLLTAFFFVVLSPVGIVMRLLGRNPLRTPHADTTWSPVDARRRGPRHYERMF
jgi:hypothetical protein